MRLPVHLAKGKSCRVQIPSLPSGVTPTRKRHTGILRVASPCCRAENMPRARKSYLASSCEPKGSRARRKAVHQRLHVVLRCRAADALKLRLPLAALLRPRLGGGPVFAVLLRRVPASAALLRAEEVAQPAPRLCELSAARRR